MKKLRWTEVGFKYKLIRRIICFTGGSFLFNKILKNILTNKLQYVNMYIRN